MSGLEDDWGAALDSQESELSGKVRGYVAESITKMPGERVLVRAVR